MTVTSLASAAATSAAAGFVTADPAIHLLRRATWGPTPASIADIRARGVTGWLNRQLAPAGIPDPVCDSVLSRLWLTRLSIGGVRGQAAGGTFKPYASDVMLQVGYAAIGRAIWSNRQLFEMMADFWSNHLNVTCPAGDVWDSRQDYDSTVIRPHALGRFADMLKASAKHPAMLTYLDNRSSTKAAPNENYGRELLELHTVGLVYSEADVHNAARLLTGLTVGDTGGYRYDPNAHAVGPVRLLGFSHANNTPAGGEAAAMQLLDYLALLPATAERIARKLCVRFVSDNPPGSLVAKLVRVYLDNRSAIVPVLRALFTSAEFGASVGAKTRTPLEDLVATVRVLGYGPENGRGTQGLQALYWLAAAAGQAPMAWAPPNGYPDVAAAWASPAGQLTRWNTHLNLAGGWWPTQLIRSPQMVTDLVGPRLPATYGALIDAVAKRLFSRTLQPRHTAAIAAFFGKKPTSRVARTDSAVGWSFPYLVALMLDSPYFAIR